MASKQVIDIRPGKSMSRGQSNEHLRVCANSAYLQKLSNNFDPTREKLNFEIGRGGVLTEVDKTRSIPQRIAANLSARGIKDPNKGKENPYHNTIANVILGGSRSRMHELAYGTQHVNLDHGSDNSHITRCPEIEQWAQDMYKFMSRKYGEENIAAFIVHLDETNPHIHCTLLPIVHWRDRERFSYRELFEGTKVEASQKKKALHDELAEVNKKWGLERGDPIALTGAQHKSYNQYLQEQIQQKEQVSDELDTTISDQRSESRHLNKNIKKAQKRLKGLSTMYENLLQKKEALEQQMKVLEQQLEKGAIDLKTYQDRKESLQKECDEVIDKLTARRQQIAEAKESLDQYLLKQINTEEEVEKLENKANELGNKVIKLQNEVTAKSELLSKATEIKDENERYHSSLLENIPVVAKALGAIRRASSTNGRLDENGINAVSQILGNGTPEERKGGVSQIWWTAKIGGAYGSQYERRWSDLYWQMDEIALNGTEEYMSNPTEALVAVQLFYGQVEAAEQIALSHGGGGGGSSSGWGRDKDDDDDLWWRKCMARARKMLRPSTPKQSQGQGKGGFRR